MADIEVEGGAARFKIGPFNFNVSHGNTGAHCDTPLSQQAAESANHAGNESPEYVTCYNCRKSWFDGKNNIPFKFCPYCAAKIQ